MFRRSPRVSRSGRLGPLLLAFTLGCAGDVTGPLSGVIITIDTTRPGALDLYGADRGITPNLVRLARASVVYERAQTVAPITLPAHASMMTGLYPLRHGIRDNGWARLSEDAQTLAERARASGYQTAAFVSAVVLSASYGLDQGFDVYSEPEPDPGEPIASMTQRGSRAVTDEVLQWLEERDSDRPFFLWVHYFDPHWPYEAPPEFVAQARGKPYLAEVAAMDHDIGRLVEALDQELGLQGFLLAVVADHGEAFGRHGEPTHSAYAYQATVHVPFLLRFPDGRRAGTRSDELISVVDLFPTFLDVLDLGDPRGVDGISLGDLPVPENRGVYMESYSGYLNYGWSPLAGWLDADGKYLHSTRPEYYDLVADPEELNDILEQRTVDVTVYRDALERLASLPRLAPGAVELDEAGLAELRALGYASAGEEARDLPDPLAPSERPAPRDHAENHAKFSKALGLAQAGKNDLAVPLLRAVFEANPGNVLAAQTLGGCLLDEDRFEDVVQLLAPLVEGGLDRYTVHVTLGRAYEELGRSEEALDHYRQALRLRPTEQSVERAIQRLETDEE